MKLKSSGSSTNQQTRYSNSSGIEENNSLTTTMTIMTRTATKTSVRLLVAGAWLLTAVSGLRISADSDAGQRLLREAIVEVEPDHRYLVDSNVEMNVGAMYIKYEGCSSFLDRSDDYYQQRNEYSQYQASNGGGGNANNYNANYYNRNNYYFQNNGNLRRLEDAEWNEQNNLNTVNLVRFTLCSNQACSKCSGQYAIDTLLFLYAYDEHKQTELQFRCEAVKNQCYCGNQGYNYNQNYNYKNNNNGQQYNDNKCYQNCYKQAGLTGCSQFDDGDSSEQFQLQEYLSCKQMDYYPASYANYQMSKQSSAGYYTDPTQYYDNGIFYVGPYCQGASELYLGTFLDDKCSIAATHATFASNYKMKSGEAFPYFKTPIVAVSECISCQDEEQVYKQTMEQAQNSGNSQYQYMQKSSYYSSSQSRYSNNQQYKANAQANTLCQYVEDADEDVLISCVMKQENDGTDNDNLNYAGCSYLGMLSKLDGRESMSIASANNMLSMNNSYTVILAALASVLIMAVLALTFCDPTAIEAKKRNLMAEQEIAHSPTSMGVEAVAD